MSDEMILQLQSSDPAKRRAAIVALANRRDPAALRLLAAVYRTDPEPKLRELALKAGQYITQQTAPASAEAGAEPSLEAPEGAVSERDRQIAQGYLSAATDFHIAGDKARAAENLGKALSVNPALQKEAFVTNLIMNVTGLGVAEALPLLTHPDRRAGFIQDVGGKQKLQRRQEHGRAAHTATWTNVLKDFAVYWLAATMSTVVIFIFTLNLIQTMFDDMTLYSTASTAENIDALEGASIIALLFVAISFGISQVISLAIEGVFIHFAATAVLGGDGLLVYLYRRLVPLQTLIALITAVIMLLLGLLGDTEALLCVIGMGATVGGLYLTYLLTRLIGEVYAFGAWSGCGALIIGGILQGVVAYIFNFVLLSLAGALLGGA